MSPSQPPLAPRKSTSLEADGLDGEELGGDGGSIASGAIDTSLAGLVANLDTIAKALKSNSGAGATRGSDAQEALEQARDTAERLRVLLHKTQDPLHRGSSTRPQGPVIRSTSTAPNASRKSILVVDDEAMMGKALARALHGYEVIVVDNAKDALARVVAGSRFELVLCDLMMPDFTGMDFYEEVVRLAPEQARRFVFLTGGAVTTRARAFVSTVPNLVLAKPFDIQKLRDLLRDREQRSDRVVLVVDDDESTRKMIVRWLTGAKFTCLEHASGTLAMQTLLSDPDGVDAVVLDVMLPGLDGFDVLSQLKDNPATSHIPIVLLTAQAIGAQDVVRGIDAGASFYLTKPFTGPVLVSKVRAACERSDSERELRMRLHFAEEHATRDALTGLMNRRAFDGRFAEAVANTVRHREPLVLAMLDLDQFKQINDTFGHGGGDRVLLYFARALRRAIRVGDQAFRYGGEEFALLLPKCDAKGALRVISRIQSDLRSRPISLAEGQPTVVRFSAGIASAETANSFRVEDLVARTDAAMYKAKNAGRDRIELE